MAAADSREANARPRPGVRFVSSAYDRGLPPYIDVDRYVVQRSVAELGDGSGVA
jgi:hypothetical protein